MLNLRGFAVRTYGSRTLSAEVDRQLQMFTGTRLEWWDAGASRPDTSHVRNRRAATGDVEVANLDHGSNR